MTTANYHAPYQFPAGILTLAVHVAFFALLYFGFTWRTLPPATMNVDLWRSIPTVTDAPPQPKVEQVVHPPVRVDPPAPANPVKPEIVLPEKPKTKIKPEEKRAIASKPIKRVVKILDETKPEVTEPITKKPPDIKPVEVKPAEPKLVEPKPVEPVPTEKKPDTSAADQQAARAQAEKSAATQRLVDEFTARISAKIRQNIVPPPDVEAGAHAEFNVILLPDGTTLPPVLNKSSGNSAYDDAVERAILKSQPLPLPPDPNLFERFRKLKLGFRPEEKKE